MIVPDSMTFEKNQGMGAYVVRGPQGEYYGSYPTYPRPDQIPPYAIVEKTTPGRGRMSFLGEEDQGVF